MATALIGSNTQETLDRVTQLAADELGAPMACVSLLDSDFQLVTSSVGMSAPIALVLTWSFCKRVIASRRSLVVPDARDHNVLRNSPAVREGSVMSYMGAPIVLGDGRAAGTLSVMDERPRTWTRPQMDLLNTLAQAVVDELEREPEMAAGGAYWM